MHTTRCMKQLFMIDALFTAAPAFRVQLEADEDSKPHFVAPVDRTAGRMLVTPSTLFPGSATNRYKRNAASVRYDVGYNPKTISLMCKPAFQCV